MNLTRVLKVALPEIPARVFSENPPRVAPGTVHKEHIESGERIVLAVVPGKNNLFRFPPKNWELIELFDGTRSFQEIAEAYSQRIGVAYSVEDVREFAASVESLGFWYKTQQETNIQLIRMSAEERQRILKSKKRKYGDLSEITFPAVDPDKFVTWLHSKTSWIYTWWFTLLTLAAFGIAVAISVTHWSEIGRDTIEFFNVTDKSWDDLLAFYLLAVVVLCVHELAHGHAAKHYGARVPAMGFLLIYLTPAFYTDTTEGYVRATKWQRVVIVIAGVWSELMICAIATPIWWATPPTAAIHQAAYAVMLMTGIVAILLNWNPLMKLDGYQMLIEFVEIPELKEDSTAYVSAWVKKQIWRLPVAVPYVPKRRRFPFAVYALLSGAYSYTVLYILARFAGNVLRNFSPEWSFIPELAVAGIIFRSRIRKLVEFMRFVYLDKRDRVRAWFTAKHSLQLGAAMLLLALLPLWHENSFGRLVLEPGHRAMLRAIVPGTVTGIYAREGLSVAAGDPLVRLENVPLQSRIDESRATHAMASSRLNEAYLQYANVGRALRDRDRAAEESQNWAEEGSRLELRSPFSGVVETSRLSDRIGSVVREGADLIEIADVAQMRGRVYIAEHDMHKVHLGAEAKLVLDGFTRTWQSQVASISPASLAADPAVAPSTQYSGLNPPKFYVVEVMIPNPDNLLRQGMVGSARIYGQRKSLLGLTWNGVSEFFGRKVW